MDLMNRSCVASSTTATEKTVVDIEQFNSLFRAAAALPGKGPLATVAMLLVLSLRLSRSDHLLLTPRTLTEFGIGRGMVYRALVELEAQGLLTVRRRRGQGPLVSLGIPVIEAEAYRSG